MGINPVELLFENINCLRLRWFFLRYHRVCEGFNFPSSLHLASFLPRDHGRRAYHSQTSQHHDLELHCSDLHDGTGNAKLNVVEIIVGNTKLHTSGL